MVANFIVANLASEKKSTAGCTYFAIALVMLTSKDLVAFIRIGWTAILLNIQGSLNTLRSLLLGHNPATGTLLMLEIQQ